MASLPRRHEFVDTSNQKIVAVVQMITHMKQAGPARTEVFFVGGNSVVVQGAIDEVSTHIWP
ncbi:MAG: hypothetical protein V7704_09685 [Aurantimonas endophytica]|uniref:hypothetical protein n=1 Tax=Aurantimonas endophytica TaxID=1522175 RepID=UPI00300355E7